MHGTHMACTYSIRWPRWMTRARSRVVGPGVTRSKSCCPHASYLLNANIVLEALGFARLNARLPVGAKVEYAACCELAAMGTLMTKGRGAVRLLVRSSGLVTPVARWTRHGTSGWVEGRRPSRAAKATMPASSSGSQLRKHWAVLSPGCVVSSCCTVKSVMVCLE